MIVDWSEIYNSTYRELDCEWLPANIRHKRKISDRGHQRREAKQRRVRETLDKFRALMESGNPPKTKEEAVKALSPILSYLLWSLFKSLFIKAVEWAWDRYQDQDSKLGKSSGE